jgi:hypothetical protein
MYQYNPGNVKFSLAQLAKEEEARKRPYVNPAFAKKESFKNKDSTEKQLGGFNPGTKLYSSERTDLGPQNSLRISRRSPMALIKPLEPNILDAAADERQKELARQRKGRKWAIVQNR